MKRHLIPPLTRSLTRLVVAVLGGLLGTALAGAVAPAPAWAHADLVRSTPAQGQVYQRPPGRLQLQFTETVTVPAGGVRLYDARGEVVPTGEPSHPPGDGTTVDVRLATELSDGGYTVSWRVTSADSHPVSGAYTFTVGVAGAGGTAPGQPPAPKSPGSVAGPVFDTLRWIGFVALALLVGVAFFVAHGWPAGARRRAVRVLLWGGWTACSATAAGMFLSYGPYLADLPLRRAFDPELLAGTLDTRLGKALTARILLLLLLVPALVVLLRRLAAGTPPARKYRLVMPVAVLTAAAALALTWGFANHSAVGELTALALGSDVVHLVAMAVWLGGLVVLAGVLLPSRDHGAMRTAVPAFSRSAQLSVALLVGTGLFHLWRQVRSVPALLETPYGRLLLAKISVVCLLLALGAVARTWVQRHYPAAGPGRPAGRRDGSGGPDPHQLYHFGRRVSMEVGLGLVVLGVTAALVATPPARVVYEARQATPGGKVGESTVPGTADGAARPAVADGGPTGTAAGGTIPFTAGSDPSASGLLLMDVLPRRVGTVTAHVSVLDPTGRPKAVPEVRVTLRLAEKDLGPLPVPLRNAGPGHYIGTVTVPLPGRWEAAVTVRTSDVDQTTVKIPLEVAR